MGLAVDQLVSSWRRSLRQRNLAPRTIQTYVESATQLAGWLVDRGVTDVDEVTRDHVADFITHLIETRSPSTASVRFRALQQFFGWLAGEGELPEPNPMEKMRPPMGAGAAGARADRRPAAGAVRERGRQALQGPAR
jgi:integrase/recombinase XerC